MRKDLPVIIQGGMGAAVSDWQLANAVSSQGQLGVVSGVALGAILARRLEMGDPGEHMRRALAAFPFKDAAQRILDRYFIEGGKDADARFAVKPMAKMNTSRRVEELIVAGNFAEIFLAKEGHDNTPLALRRDACGSRLCPHGRRHTTLHTRHPRSPGRRVRR